VQTAVGHAAERAVKYDGTAWAMPTIPMTITITDKRTKKLFFISGSPLFRFITRRRQDK
jgi:hypothetical protein